MKKVFAILLFFILHNGFAQKTDSLKKLYAPNLADTQQCNILLKIGYSYYINDGQLDSSLVYLQKAKALAFKNKFYKTSS